ncbi:hypothetical protein ADL27_31770, partial [Streptomyces sp. NRRL F-6602]
GAAQRLGHDISGHRSADGPTPEPFPARFQLFHDRQFADPSVPPVIETVLRQSETVLRTYQVDPGLVQEHANGERRITQGGYGERQLLELVQNAADEIANAPGGKLHVVLTEDHLYCANEGTPVTPEGAETILRMSVSRKRGGQIGRFGVGVK